MSVRDSSADECEDGEKRYGVEKGDIGQDSPRDLLVWLSSCEQENDRGDYTDGDPG